MLAKFVSRLKTSYGLKKICNYPPNQGLYNKKYEKDSCGVGFVVNLEQKSSHNLIKNVHKCLLRLDHRSARGSDPNCGDGIGINVGLPHSFLQHVVDFELPQKGNYGVGMLFFSQEMKPEEFQNKIQELAKVCNLTTLGWRQVPVNNWGLGRGAILFEPQIWQLFTTLNQQDLLQSDPAKFQQMLQKQLYLLKRQIMNSFDSEEVYPCSVSNNTLVYKGQLTAEQLFNYYYDLVDSNFESNFAVFHSRFATNTFPD